MFAFVESPELFGFPSYNTEESDTCGALAVSASGTAPATLSAQAEEVLLPMLREMDLNWEQSFLLRQALLDLEVSEAYGTVADSLRRADQELLNWVSSGAWIDRRQSEPDSDWEYLGGDGTWSLLEKQSGTLSDYVAIEQEEQKQWSFQEDAREGSQPGGGGAASVLAQKDRKTLRQTLLTSSPRQAAAAALGLAQSGDLRVGEVLNVMEDCQDGYARSIFMTVLGMLGDSQALPHLLEALKDQDPQVRFTSLKSLKTFAGRVNKKTIKPLLSDPVPYVANAAGILYASL